MKKIVIIGAGGFGREVQWLIERINEVSPEWEFLGYIDDGIKEGNLINDKPVLGNVEYLAKVEEPLDVVCAIGNARVRKTVIEKIRKNKQLCFPNVIDPSVLKSERLTWGMGIIVCAASVLTVDIEVGDFVIINLDCTIGHDVVLDSYVTLYPSINVSGVVHIGEQTEVGTGTQIIQGRNIGELAIVGAGSVVVKDIPSRCTAVGCPAKVIKSLE